jgi:hypothetical protein
MRKIDRAYISFIVVSLLVAVSILTACGGKVNFLGKKGVPLQIEKIDPTGGNPNGGNTDNGSGTGGTGGTGGNTAPDTYQDIKPTSTNGLHPIFSAIVGVAISPQSMSSVANDPSGYNALTDSDGDGIPDDQELNSEFSNPYVSDCPRITTRIETPVNMEIVYEYNGKTQTHDEMVTDSDVKNTLDNSMDNKQYNQLNLKTVSYPVKNALSWSQKDAGSMGTSSNFSMETSATAPETTMKNEVKEDISVNTSFDNERSHSIDSEKTEFKNVDFVDNLNRNGTEYKNDTTERVSKNYRQSNLTNSDTVVGANAGHVSASLYIINESRNIPVRVSNVICTLSFRTPSGNCLAISTFRLRNDDYSEFDEEIYGGEELGPYLVDVPNLNTVQVKNALANGYVPQIHVVSYDMHKVENSNYNPGVDNLKIVEETAKSRTAIIKVIGSGTREIYRVPAFEVVNGVVTPGISLKKALFRIYQSRIGSGESFEIDSEGNDVTVNDQGLKWKSGFVADTENPDEYVYQKKTIQDPNDSNKTIEVVANSKGNTWSMFSTYVKSYQVVDHDATGKLSYHDRHIESIDRIGKLKKFNPFTTDDNPAYDVNTPLTEDEFCKLKYWIILHNGRYFEGDVNDPIWAGERYEIVLFDAKDFNERFKTYAYTPLMNTTGATDNTSSSSNNSSGGDYVDYSAIRTDYDFQLSTIWNKTYDGRSEFARSRYLGKVVRGDVIRLDIQLDQFKSLFDVDKPGKEFEPFISMDGVQNKIWSKFNYTFDDGTAVPSGIPGDFSFRVWGGCNQITLNIVESSNAANYTISFWPKLKSDNSSNAADRENERVVKVLPADLLVNNGYIMLDRNSVDINGVSVGAIAAVDYYIEVRANGSTYNVPVSTKSTTGTLGVTINGPPTSGDIYPKAFTIQAEGMTNSFSLVINQGADTEYYMADVYGPYNYGYGNGSGTPPFKRFMVHAGANLLTMSRHDLIFGGYGLTDDEKNWAVPGVYKVMVYGVNKNCLPQDGNVNNVDMGKVMPLQSDPAPVLIDYNRYENQKKLLAKTQIGDFSPQDVDLEVNFNDGSGWFRLKLSHDDIAEEDRSIDCRYTTNFKQNQGRVTIYFTAPTGSQGPQNKLYNVFRGGAEDVEVYLRTVEKPEYRDSIWLKSSDGDQWDPINPDRYHCITINSLINDLPGYDPLMYWITNPDTDATMIENYDINGAYHPRVFGDMSGLGTTPAGDFRVVAPFGKEDFFFSPMRELSYKVGVSLSDVDIASMIKETTHADKPEYRPMGGYQSIKLSNMDSQYADNFVINWKPVGSTGSGTTVTLPANDANHTYTIGSLAPNTSYIISVTATNASSISSARTTTISTLPEKQEYQLVSASNSYGYGTFSDPAVPLTNFYGNILRNGTDFTYDTSIANKCDSGTSGALAGGSGKYIRIVEGGRNILTYLTPIAKDLSGIFTSPPGNQCYIDPVSGKFVLPRPDYWSTMDSNNDITVPRIYEEVPVMTNTSVDYSTGKWGLALDLNSGFGGNMEETIYPFGTNYIVNKGTLSLWISTSNPTNPAWQGTYIYIGNQSSIKVYRGHALVYINNELVKTINFPAMIDTFHHFYMIWDKSGSLSNSQTLMIYTDGVYRDSITNTWVDGAFSIYGYAQYSLLGWDNLKIWKHVVAENAAWEYNNVNDSGLHATYGSANGYRPVLTLPNGGVGFYCVPSQQ